MSLDQKGDKNRQACRLIEDDRDHLLVYMQRLLASHAISFSFLQVRISDCNTFLAVLNSGLTTGQYITP